MSYNVFVPISFARIEPVFGINAALEYIATAAGARSVRTVFFEKGIVTPSPNDRQTIRSTMTMLRNALMRGAIAAYVEDPERNKYYRIPDIHWSFISDLEAMRELLHGCDAPGASHAVDGQPVLISRSELDRFLFKGEGPVEPSPAVATPSAEPLPARTPIELRVVPKPQDMKVWAESWIDRGYTINAINSEALKKEWPGKARPSRDEARAAVKSAKLARGLAVQKGRPGSHD